MIFANILAFYLHHHNGNCFPEWGEVFQLGHDDPFSKYNTDDRPYYVEHQPYFVTDKKEREFITMIDKRIYDYTKRRYTMPITEKSKKLFLGEFEKFNCVINNNLKSKTLQAEEIRSFFLPQLYYMSDAAEAPDEKEYDIHVRHLLKVAFALIKGKKGKDYTITDNDRKEHKFLQINMDLYDDDYQTLPNNIKDMWEKFKSVVGCIGSKIYWHDKNHSSK